MDPIVDDSTQCEGKYHTIYAKELGRPCAESEGLSVFTKSWVEFVASRPNDSYPNMVSMWVHGYSSGAVSIMGTQYSLRIGAARIDEDNNYLQNQKENQGNQIKMVKTLSHNENENPTNFKPDPTAFELIKKVSSLYEEEEGKKEEVNQTDNE